MKNFLQLLAICFVFPFPKTFAADEIQKIVAIQQAELNKLKVEFAALQGDLKESNTRISGLESENKAPKGQVSALDADAKSLKSLTSGLASNSIEVNQIYSGGKEMVITFQTDGGTLKACIYRANGSTDWQKWNGNPDCIRVK